MWSSLLELENHAMIVAINEKVVKIKCRLIYPFEWDYANKLDEITLKLWGSLGKEQTQDTDVKKPTQRWAVLHTI